jgi:hypothetical protein
LHRLRRSRVVPDADPEGGPLGLGRIADGDGVVQGIRLSGEAASGEACGGGVSGRKRSEWDERVGDGLGVVVCVFDAFFFVL